MRARAVIEAEPIGANAAAKRCQHVIDGGRSRWDLAHRGIDALLHEWRQTVAAETPEPV